MPWTAGTYHPNPFHPPLVRVRVQTWLGPRTRWVIKAPVEKAFADYPDMPTESASASHRFREASDVTREDAFRQGVRTQVVPCDALT